MNTDTNLQAHVNTASEKLSTLESAPKVPLAHSGSASAPKLPTAVSAPAASAPAASAPKEAVEPQYKSEDYDGAKIVRLRLRTPGIIQYDQRYDLKLDTAAKEGVPMPLTPFFAGRLNSTVELVV
jgi:hypothetical protein